MFGKIKGFFTSIKDKLSNSSSNIKQIVSSVLKQSVKIDENTIELLEEALIMSDVSVKTTQILIENIKKRVRDEKFENEPTEEFFLNLISDEVDKILRRDDLELNLNPDGLSVILISGVNGSGKTTTVGKLSGLLTKISDKKIMLVAADTFRAAAIDQLKVWSERSNVSFFSNDLKDPASVVYSALDEASKQNIEILIIDTAGRLANNSNLMLEIKKVEDVIIKKTNSFPLETLLVLDGTSGQNAISQIEKFKEVIKLTGIIITKLDSSSKAGFAISTSRDFDLPIKFIGVGEKLEDLVPFDPSDFSKALFK